MNCSCISDNMNAVNSAPSFMSATDGICPAKDCVLLPLFCAVFFIAMFFLFIEGIFNIQVVIR